VFELGGRSSVRVGRVAASGGEGFLFDSFLHGEFVLGVEVTACLAASPVDGEREWEFAEKRGRMQPSLRTRQGVNRAFIKGYVIVQ